MSFEEVKEVFVDTLSCELEGRDHGGRPWLRIWGADSLDAVELNIALEEQLGLSIADEDRPNMKTVGDIVRYLEALEGTKDNRI